MMAFIKFLYAASLALIPMVTSSDCPMIPSVDTIVSKLNLVPRNEGGWIRETFRSNISVAVPFDTTNEIRSALSSVHFLIQDSLNFHLPQFSETWSYYWGSHSVTIYELINDEVRTTVLGNNISTNDGTSEVVQHTIETGTWYGAKLNSESPDAYALIGKQAGPAFEFKDWTAVGNATDLVALFPDAEDIILELSNSTNSSTRPTGLPQAHACVFPSVQELVDLYDLVQHPEGGFFVETFRSSLQVEGPHGSRNAMTSIYYAMFAGNNSDFHRLTSDETWNYYFGETIYLYELHDQDDTNLRTIRLGTDLSSGEVSQYTVTAGTWFGAEVDPSVSDDGSYSLFGANVGPGFDYQDFELASASELIEEFPGAADKILELTPDEEETTPPTNGPTTTSVACRRRVEKACSSFLAAVLMAM